MDPVPDGKCGGDQAEGDEDHHAPDKCRRLGDAQDGGAEFHRQDPKESKSDGARDKIDGGQAPQGIAERAGGGNDHGEGKRRRRKAADGDGDSGAIADIFLESVELLLTRYFSDAFLAEFAGDFRKQNHAHGRTAGGAENIQGKSGVAMRDEADDEEIVSKGKDEEGRVENAEDKRAEIAKVEQKMKKRAKCMGHRTLFLKERADGSLAATR